MRGAAIHFARQIDDLSSFDLVVCTGLMSVADFRALAPDPPRRRPPILLYAHETQLSYPSPAERESDLHFAFTDLANMLAADHVAFNSRMHRDAYLEALPGFLRRLPEYRPTWAVDAIRAKSSHCYPGIRPAAAPALPGGHGSPRAGTPPPPASASFPRPAHPAEAPLVLWNHRWEFDKNPEAFFAAVREVKARGARFRLALLGENYQVVPRPFVVAREEFADEIVHYGYVPDRADYDEWLARADVVISTAVQENFGISVLEAIAHGAAPLLPARLSYPEIVPTRFHDSLYADDDELTRKLFALLTGRDRPAAPEELVEHARSFAWEQRIGEFDALFERVAGRTRG